MISDDTESSSRIDIAELEHIRTSGEPSCRTVQDSPRTSIGQLERTECWNDDFRRHKNLIKDRYRTLGTAAPGRSDDSSSRTDIRLLKQLLQSAPARTAIGELERTEFWNTDFGQHREVIRD